jgi:N utilization substance protein B
MSSQKTQAREFALQYLYQTDLVKIYYFSQSHFSSFCEQNHIEESLGKILRTMVEGTLENLIKTDQTIKSHSKNWPLERMASIDRAILRMATYELLATQTPVKVILNEAIELSKVYGSNESPSFINGVLDSIQKKIRSK